MLSCDKLLNSSITTALMWLMLASSSVVIIEPAFYDVIGLGLFIVLFSMGLRLPVGIGLPLSLFGVFLVANLVAASMILEPADAFKSVWIRSSLVFNWLLFASIVFHQPRRYLPVIWHGYVTASVIAVIIGLGAYLHLIPVGELALQYDRVRGTFKDPNVFGPFLIPPLLYLVIRFEKLPLRSSWVYVLAALLLVAGIFLSFSRGAWLATVFSFFVYWCIRYRIECSEKSRARLLFILALAVLVALATLAMGMLSSGSLGGTFTNRFSISQEYDSDRFTSQKEAIKLAPTNPIGVGPSQASTALPARLVPHNIYLHVLLETGWFGAAALYLFLLITIVFGYKCCKTKNEVQSDTIVIFSSLVGLLLQSIFIDSTHWRHFYLLMGLLWGTILYTEYRERSTKRATLADSLQQAY